MAMISIMIGMNKSMFFGCLEDFVDASYTWNYTLQIPFQTKIYSNYENEKSTRNQDDADENDMPDIKYLDRTSTTSVAA